MHTEKASNKVFLDTNVLIYQTFIIDKLFTFNIKDFKKFSEIDLIDFA